MATFRDKHLKNELNPKSAYYDCIRSCKINSESQSIPTNHENYDLECLKDLSLRKGYEYLKARYIRKN